RGCFCHSITEPRGLRPPPVTRVQEAWRSQLHRLCVIDDELNQNINKNIGVTSCIQKEYCPLRYLQRFWRSPPSRKMQKKIRSKKLSFRVFAAALPKRSISNALIPRLWIQSLLKTSVSFLITMSSKLCSVLLVCKQPVVVQVKSAPFPFVA